MTLFSTARAAGESPKETLLTPARSSTPGSSVFDRRMPSRVSMAERVELRVAGRQGEGERIEDQVLRAQAVLVHGDIVDAPGNLQLAVGGLGHALLVDGQDDHGGVVLLGQGKNPVGFGAPGFQVGGIEQAAPGGGLEGDFHAPPARWCR